VQICACGARRRAKRHAEEPAEAGGEPRPATRARAAAGEALPMAPPGARGARQPRAAGRPLGAEAAAPQPVAAADAGTQPRAPTAAEQAPGPSGMHCRGELRDSPGMRRYLDDCAREAAAGGLPGPSGPRPAGGMPAAAAGARGSADAAAGAAGAAGDGKAGARGAPRAGRAQGSTCAGEGGAYAVAAGGAERPTASTGTSRPRRCAGAR
jgi:translation initiation factor IF-2